MEVEHDRKRRPVIGARHGELVVVLVAAGGQYLGGQAHGDVGKVGARWRQRDRPETLLLNCGSLGRSGSRGLGCGFFALCGLLDGVDVRLGRVLGVHGCLGGGRLSDLVGIDRSGGGVR